MDVKNIVLGTKADYRSIHMAWFYQYEILERSDSIRKKIRRPPCQSSGMTLEPSSRTSSGACRQRLRVSILPTGVWHHFCAHVGPRPIHQRADSSSGRQQSPRERSQELGPPRVGRQQPHNTLITACRTLCRHQLQDYRSPTACCVGIRGPVHPQRG